MMLKVHTLPNEAQSENIISSKIALPLCDKEYEVDLTELSPGHIKEFVIEFFSIVFQAIYQI
jgi:hypothetical protein